MPNRRSTTEPVGNCTAGRLVVAYALSFIVGLAVPFAVVAIDARAAIKNETVYPRNRDRNLEALDAMFKRLRESTTGDRDNLMLSVANEFVRLDQPAKARAIAQSELSKPSQSRLEWMIASHAGDVAGMRRSLKSIENVTDPSQATVRTLIFLAERFIELGDLAEARSLALRALARVRAEIDAKTLKWPISDLSQIATVQVKAGDRRMARETLNFALETKDTHLSEGDYYGSLRHLIVAFGLLGDVEDATAIAERIIQFEWDNSSDPVFKKNSHVARNVGLEFNAVAFAKGGLFAEAFKSLDQRRSVHEWSTMEDTLLQIAIEQIERGQRVEGYRTFERAIQEMQRGLLIFELGRIDRLISFADSLVQAREPLPMWFSEIVEIWFTGAVVERKRSVTSIRDIVKVFATAGDSSAVKHWLSRYTDAAWFADFIKSGGIGNLQGQSQFETEAEELARAYVWADDFPRALKLAELMKGRTPFVVAKIVGEMGERHKSTKHPTHKN